MTNLPELPSGWRWKTVADLAADQPNAITDGPFGSNLKTSHYTESGPRVVRLQNIGDGVFIDAPAHISLDHYERLSKHRVEAGDIVIAALGEAPPRACLIPESLGPAIVKADCIRFRPHSAHNAKYLGYALNSESTRRWVKPIVHGVGRPRLNLKEIKSIPLPVAPRDEQDRIVDEIEKQLTRLEAGVAALRRVQANLKRHRAAVLKAACEGRLVPTEAELARREGRLVPTEADLARREGRPCEPASALLDRIHIERTKALKATPASRRSTMRQDDNATSGLGHGALPEGWCHAELARLASIGVGFAFKSEEFVDEGMRLLRGDNVEPGRLRWAGARHWPAEKLGPYSSLLVAAGDIILAMDRPIVSAGLKLARARAGDLPCVLVQRVARIRAYEPASSDFLYVALQAGTFRAHLLGSQAGTQLPHISSAQIGAFRVPVPPLSEQHRLVAEVERRLSLADDLERLVSANLHRATRLRQSILAAAFSGGLSVHAHGNREDGRG